MRQSRLRRCQEMKHEGSAAYNNSEVAFLQLFHHNDSTRKARNLAFLIAGKNGQQKSISYIFLPP